MTRTELQPSDPVGLVGTGVMGSGIARNLMAAGHPLKVFNRTPARAAALVAAGASWCASAGAAAAGVRAVLTIVGVPDDVRHVYLGPDGVLSHAAPGTLAIDMSTSEPELARELYDLGDARGVSVLDAPVSGGDVGARDGTLSIMVGGDYAAFQQALPLFQEIGRTVVYQGPEGSGQHTKMANQIAIASTVLGVMEALAYVRRAGLDPNAVLESIGAGAAGSWTMSHLYPRAARGDFAPGFFVRHFLKDMAIARGTARTMALELKGLALVESLYAELAAGGGADLGTQALLQRIEREPSPGSEPA